MNAQKSQLLKLEDIIPQEAYAFTINPESQYFDKNERSTNSRMAMVTSRIKSILRSPNFQYKLYMEYSPTGRIHGHGWIWIFNPMAFLDEDIHGINEKAHIEIDTINNEDIWFEYCTKQCHITQTMIYRFLPIKSEVPVYTVLSDYKGWEMLNPNKDTNNII